MTNNIYKIAALAAFLLLFAFAIYIYRPNQNNKLTRVTVIGDSKAQVAPDTAQLTFSVVTQGRQAIDAQQENARVSDAVHQSIVSAAANATAEIKTSNYSLNPEQDYSGKMPKIVGYEVRNTITVSISNLDLVGAVIDAATKAGANSVEGIQFVIGETSPAQGEALSLATKQAMAKAEAIARSMNGRIVRIVETTEGGIPTDHPLLSETETYSNSASTSANTSVRTPVQAGTLNVRSSVILVVEIER